MRLRARQDANHNLIVGVFRSCGCMVQDLSAVGGGVPDLLIGQRSRKRLFLVEVKDGDKAPSDRRLTDAQTAWHADWAGLPVYVIKDDREALALLTIP